MGWFLLSTSMLTLLCFALAVGGAVAVDNVCPFLPVDSAPVIEFALPRAVLSNPTAELSIMFEGISTPIVTRKSLPFGATPRLIIERYSSKPYVEFDESNGSVVVRTGRCGGVGSSNNVRSSASTGQFRYITAAVSVALGLADDSFRSYAWVAAFITAFATLIPPVGAEYICSHSVKVVVEAPEAYMGAVETCWAEINNTAVCPLPFPTFDTCDDPNPACGVAVVGAGAGGLYTALRMVDTGKISASEVCIFEMTERVGGRLFSLRGVGADNDLSVDAGGYRTWPLYTPTLHALITEYLGIPMACYDDTNPCERFNIVDDSGNKAGFATFVEEMMTRLVDGGACFYPHHELSKIMKTGATTEVARNVVGSTVSELYFSNGVKATASLTTILNLPQRPLMNIVRESNFDAFGILDAQKLDALHSVQTVIATKLYLYYPRGHVFWYKLGLRVGEFEYEGDARNMLLGGRYHDGHVNCDDENDIDTCHGFLLAVYVSDLSGNKAQFFRRYQRERAEPVTFISNQDLEGSQFLKHAHSRLEQYHLYDNPGANYTGFQATQVFQQTNPPEFAILSTWNEAVPWAGGGWHAWTEIDNLDLAIEPFVDDNIFVVNEAFSLLHGWAEGSIKVADRILEKHFDIPRPWSFPVDDLNQIVQQTSSTECPEAADTSSGGGTSNGTSTGGESGAGATDDDPFCFTADALILMADGSVKRIEDVHGGDHVMTGTGHGEGIVTQKLIHPVKDVVPVAIIKTDMGDLVGTPSHPVLIGGQWKELAHHEHATLSSQYVDTFYNLEVDGHVTVESTHSYMAHGLTASGLGDNKVLNRLYPRQEVWKNEVAGGNGMRMAQV